MKMVRIVIRSLMAVCAIGACSASMAQAADTSVSVLPADLRSCWTLNAAQGLVAPLAVVPVTGQPFTEALHVEVLKPAEHDYDIQLVAKTAAPIAKGDVCLFTAYLRGTPTGGRQDSGAMVQAMFERIKVPYDNSLREPSIAGNTWQKIELPFVAAADFPAGEAKFNFRLGYQPETVEVGEPSLVDYGKSRSLADLPRTPISYIGREANADWRKAALARIEKLRKADLTVRVVDADGKPEQGAQVTALLTRNAFPIGTAMSDHLLAGPQSESADAKRWREEFLRHFTSGTAGILTWRWWESQETKTMDFATLDWLDKNGIKDIHGAHLVWTWWDRLPPGVVTTYRNTARTDPKRAGQELQSATLAHIDSKLAALKGRITVWNGINEVTENREMAETAGGVPAMAAWFQEAKKTEPKASFIINDYDILTRWGVNTTHLDDYYNLIKGLKDAGAPVGGIGFQSHFQTLLTSPAKVVEILDRFATLGVPLYITEFDTRLPATESAVQADYTRDFLLAVYSHPAVAGFTMWGFWDGDSWINNAPLFAKDWTLKPSGRAFLSLTEDAWKTRASGMTDAKGCFTAHGTLGEYSLKAIALDGRTVTGTAILAHTGVTVVLHLPGRSQ